jgi:hypothetical protein
MNRTKREERERKSGVKLKYVEEREAVTETETRETDRERVRYFSPLLYLPTARVRDKENHHHT